jgi:hypothetical protein
MSKPLQMIYHPGVAIDSTHSISSGNGQDLVVLASV